MLIEHPRLKGLVTAALESAPVLVERLLQNVPDATWDKHIDPERFTLREVVCHLADWENVFQGRIKLQLEEENPAIPVLDPGKIALEGEYGKRDALEAVEQFKERRSATVQLLQDLRPEQWSRSGQIDGAFGISIEGWSIIMPKHDMYHIRQISDYISAT